VTDIHEEDIEQVDVEEHSTRGTFIILMAYLVVIVGLWGTIYLTLLSRG
jgi:hypothetical protein